jgi:hypothetical protein
LQAALFFDIILSKGEFMPEVAQTSPSEIPMPPSMLDPEHTESGKKGKYFISFPDGTTGTFTT